MRFVLLAVVVVALLTAYTLYPKVPRFEHRAALDPSSGLTSLTRPPVSPLLKLKYTSISDQVLLIRTLNVVDGLTDVAAPRIAQLALQTGGLATKDDMNQVVHAWLHQFVDDHPIPLSSYPALEGAWQSCYDATANCVDTVPLRLLAVVFRPDLAHFQCGGDSSEGSQACDAEIRFDYGLIDQSGKSQSLNAIFEFVLAPKSKSDFQKMAADWQSMKSISAADLPATLDQKLNTYLFATGAISSARVRISAEEGSAKPWDIYEYHFQNRGIERTNLDGEIGSKWYGGHCALSQPASQFAAGFDLNADRIAIPQALAVDASEFIAPFRIELGQPTAGSTIDPQVRFRLALNTCSGCHSTESGMAQPFSQIRNRDSGQVSTLSPFLTGSDTGGDPTMGYHTVSLTFNGLHDCQSPAETHSFNDLLRRELYLDKMLSLDPAANNWADQLRGLAAYEAH
jgi:hypothetical protein